MSDDQQTKKQKTPPETFVKQVKDALDHLYDFPYLERHPLAQEVADAETHPNEMASQRLRRALIAAIESLSLGAEVPFRDPRARSYNLLLLHYVEGMTVQEVAHDLGISRRQAHRDLRQGIESVALVMWAHRSRATTTQPRARQISSIQAEMERLEAQSNPTDMLALLKHARQMVNPLAAERSVTIEIEEPPMPIAVIADRAIARQALINVLSRGVRHAQGTLHVTLAAQEDRKALLTLRYPPKPEASQEHTSDHVFAQLAQRLEWTLTEQDVGKEERIITLRVKTRCPSILVIDDNKGLVALLDDYLTGHACRVIAATTGQEGLRLAQEASPDAILLDVMMPETDGWEILQRLRTNPQTAATPVIICSVIDDPDLAYALGASLFLPKPINREAVLQALNQVGVV